MLCVCACVLVFVAATHLATFKVMVVINTTYAVGVQIVG